MAEQGKSTCTGSHGLAHNSLGLLRVAKRSIEFGHIRVTRRQLPPGCRKVAQVPAQLLPLKLRFLGISC